MKRRSIVSLVCAALLTVTSITPLAGVAASLSFVSQLPTPTPASGAPGDFVTFNILIDSVAGLSSTSIEGVDWTVTYDATRLLVSAGDVSAGSTLLPATVLANVATAGQIIFAISPTSAIAPTLAAGDVVSSIKFQIRGDASAGLASVSLDKIVFNETDEILNAATTNVQVVPAPATAGLLLTALAALGLRSGRFRRRVGPKVPGSSLLRT